MKAKAVLPEITLLYDARGARPENAVGVGEFWYEPEVWELSLPPSARVLYVGLCSFLGHGQINRKDLRNTLKDCADKEVESALEALVRHTLLIPVPKTVLGETLPGYEVRSVREFEG